MPRACRFIFCGRRRKLCRLQAELARILPVPVKRKRFLAADLFFSLGISSNLSLSEWLNARSRCDAERLGPPVSRTARRASRGSALYTRAIAGWQGGPGFARQDVSASIRRPAVNRRSAATQELMFDQDLAAEADEHEPAQQFGAFPDDRPERAAKQYSRD